jgi:hypothetical protein
MFARRSRRQAANGTRLWVDAARASAAHDAWAASFPIAVSYRRCAMSSFVTGALRALCVGAMGVALSASLAYAGAQDFVLINETGVDIYEVYVSPSDVESWEEDILGVDVLPDGDSVEVGFDREEDSELWDLKVSDSEGNSLLWGRLNLLRISELTLRYDNGQPTAMAR